MLVQTFAELLVNPFKKIFVVLIFTLTQSFKISRFLFLQRLTYSRKSKSLHHAKISHYTVLVLSNRLHISDCEQPSCRLLLDKFVKFDPSHSTGYTLEPGREQSSQYFLQEAGPSTLARHYYVSNPRHQLGFVYQPRLPLPHPVTSVPLESLSYGPLTSAQPPASGKFDLGWY